MKTEYKEVKFDLDSIVYTFNEHTGVGYTDVNFRFPVNMNVKNLKILAPVEVPETLKEFREEFLLDEDYEYSIEQDDGGKTLDIIVPEGHAKFLRQKIPRRWRGIRTMIISRKKRKQIDEDEIDIKEIFRTLYRYKYMIILFVIYC